MRTAVIHYHLRPGGVTRVISCAAAALAGRDVSTLVLSGTPPPAGGIDGVACRHVPALGYSGGPVPNPEGIVDLLLATAKDHFKASPDLWHFHNHSLGKNLALTAAAGLLAEKGHCVLLQIHDFAEDSRPALFKGLRETCPSGSMRELGRLMYPLAPQVHYAALNSRDAALLKQAGVAPDMVHTLPNPVFLAGAAQRPGGNEKERIFLYPTRAIARKNLGEFLFWAAAARCKDRFLVTLAPENPSETPAYEKWTALARELGLPVEFEAGAGGCGMSEMLNSCHAAVTTSVAEGFGLAFLEPWLLNCPVLGRDLPEITADFREAGIDLSALYPRLPIPGSWIEIPAWRACLKAGIESCMAAYGRGASESDFQRAEAAALDKDGVDFARLDPKSQRRAVTSAKRAGYSGFSLGDGLRDSSQAAAALVARNREAVIRAYSIERYADSLLKVYSETAASSAGVVAGGADVGRMLDFFLAPERFFILRGGAGAAARFL